jgi:RimJ/RimL family protein N-acetyltransferase
VLGIWIGAPYWDRGYGTDAVRMLCRFGFLHPA